MNVSWASIIISFLCGIVVFNEGVLESRLLGIYDLGFSLRMDSLSILMLTMITLLGLVIIKFSNNYLEGDHHQISFIGRLSATIASVQLLVLSGNLGQLMIMWIATSLCLHQLLTFSKRPQAITVAHKKFIVARLGDFFLLIAVILLYNEFGTGHLESIFTKIEVLQLQGISWTLEMAAICIAMAALFKSGQFPTHGWLIEVVETPTPVSALLHAGLLNAGPFLIVRMAFLMGATSYSSMLLIIVGGFTAFFASVSFLTQPSLKVSLGYSSIAHMGFMLLVCGLGGYGAVMLHLVAHSFYKAHAFLSSGSIIDVVRANKLALPKRLGSPFRVFITIITAISLYSLVAFIWNVNPINNFALFSTGLIIVLGLSQIMIGAFDSNGGFQSILQVCLLALSVAFSFFALEKGTHHLLAEQIPHYFSDHFMIVVLTSLMLLVFISTVVIQLLAPVFPVTSLTYRLGIHFRNGFYANALFDCLVSKIKNNHLFVETNNSSKEDKPVFLNKENTNRIHSKTLIQTK